MTEPKTRQTLLLLALVALVAVVVRLPLLHLPLDPDEGGYAYIASRWAAGAPLYSLGAWVDRPQGLMLVFRLVTDLSYTATALRIGAVVAGVVLSLGSASTAWAVAGRRAAVAAGAIAAVVSAGPFIEGYEFNGELIASSIGVAGLAVAFWWRRESLGAAWLVLAGVLCASAPLMKQSAWDPIVVLAVLVVTECVRRSRSGRRVLAPALAAALGVALPLAAAAVDATLTGWSRWWDAVVSFQSTVAATVGFAARLMDQRQTLVHVLPDLLGVALVAAIGVVVIVHKDGTGRWHDVVDWPLLAWPLVAVLEVVSGPFAHPHYWVQVVAPLAVLAGIAIGRRPIRVAVVLAVIALIVPLGVQAYLSVQTPARRAALVITDGRLLENGRVSAWVRANTGPHDSVYAFVASADLYLLAGRTTGYPYLWYANVQSLPGARSKLATWLSGPNAPTWILVYQKPDTVDPSGELADILDQRYTHVATVDGVPVLKLTE